MGLLRQLDELPDGLLSKDASQLHEALQGPTLLHLKGRRQPALFVSVLMHGNETTSWEAMRQVLGKYLSSEGRLDLPRSLSLFIANTAAAQAGLRHLPEQPDYNRVWPGGEHSEGPEAQMMHQVVEIMRTRGVFASVDLHNNTGTNPHYACVNVLEHSALHLAALFSRSVVYFVRPRGVASMAMAQLAPSVTLECGKVGLALGTAHALEYLDACLHLAELPTHPVPAHDIDLFHTVAIVRVPERLEFGFGEQGKPLEFVADLDRLNFRELASGTILGRVDDDVQQPLDVRDESGKDVTDLFFTREQGLLKTRLPLMPSMLTRDQAVIRQDCLGYLMERYDRHLLEVG